jgi:uncharacterized protein (TIGR03083 family)
MTNHRPNGLPTSQELDELCTAYVVDALDAAARARLETLAAADPVVATRLDRLLAASALLVEPDATVASPLAGTVMARALGARAAGRSLLSPASVPSVADVHRGQAAGLADLARELTTDDLRRPTRFGHTVQGVFAHLLGQLERTATLLGDGTFADASAGDYQHWPATTPYLDRYGDGDPAELWSALDDVNARLAALLDVDAGDPGDLASPAARGLGKTFEVWMHADDVRLATGRPVSIPDAGTLHVLCAFAAGVVPVTMALTGVAHPGRSARLVLTGPGGGVHLVALAPGESPAIDSEAAVTLVAEGHLLCRLFHRQIASADAEVEVEGDAALGADVLAAVGALAENT